MAVKRVAYAVSVLILLTIGLLSVPSTRAAMEAFTKEIGTLIFNVTDVYPGSEDKSEVVIHKPEKVTLEEAEARYPHKFNLPTWLPEGCTLEPLVDLYSSFPEGGHINITWRSGADPDRNCALDMSVNPQGLGWLVGENALEEVTVNDVPAALIAGGWDSDSKSYDTNLARHLMWDHGEVQYGLQTYSDDITIAELIQIAESIP